MALTAADIMTTEVITITPSTPIADFARTCAEDGVSGMPVTHVDGTLVGIVSKTDLVQHLLDNHSKFGTREDAPSWDMDIQQVGDIMQDDVMTVEPDEELAVIAQRMANDRVHRVVVVDKRGGVLGIVTSLDLLEHWNE